MRTHEHELLMQHLPELQQRQLVIVKAIVELCRSHELSVLASAGTLLGAIRHNGYIPWDDDVDLMMPRQDYRRLSEILRNDPPSGLVLWSEKTDPSYHLPFMKVVALETGKFRNTWPPDISKKFTGPRIDIFPLDEVDPYRSWALVIQKKLISLLRWTIYKKRIGGRLVGHFRFSELCVAALVKSFGFDALHMLLQRVAASQNGKPNSTHVINWMSIYSYKKEIAPKSAFSTIEWDFEDTKLPVPSGYEMILTSIYGDYRTPPPIAERFNRKHSIRYFP